MDQAAGIAAGGLLGQLGGGDGGEGDAEHADREVEDAKGVLELGDGAVAEAGGEAGVDEDVDLDRGDAEHRGEHEAGDPPHAGVAPGAAQGQARAVAEAPQRGQEVEALDHAGGEGAHAVTAHMPPAPAIHRPAPQRVRLITLNSAGA